VLTRVGKPPKFAIPFRTEEPFKKYVVNLIAPDGSEGQKIEFLADGEQVVVAGIHPETKQPYQWSNDGLEQRLEQIKHEDLPYTREAEARALVDELVDLLERGHGYKRAAGRPKDKVNGGARPKDDWTHLFENIREGREWHDSLAVLAAKLAACGTNSGAAIHQLNALMEATAAPKDARWLARKGEIPRLVDSAFTKYGKKAEPEAEAAKPKYRFQLKTHSTITASTARNYLVKGILPRVGLAVVWGPPKCGKSFWVYDLVMHIACGRKYRGHRVQQGAVVYCALEGGSGFANRVEAWRQHHLAARTEPVPFYLLDVPVDLIADCKALIADIHAQVVDHPAVIVIDTLNRAIAGDENSSEDMAKFIRAADTIRATFDCLMLVIHHCGVAKNRPRGHTSLAGADDAQIAIERDKNGNVIATIEFMKDGEGGAVLVSKLEKVPLGKDADGDELSSLVAVRSEDIIGGSKLTKIQRFAFDLLKKLITSEGVEPPAEANLPAGFKVCPSDTWRKRFYETYPADVKPDAKRKALLRATLDLEEQKLIVLWREYVWLAAAERDKPGEG
jgi:AAA domain